MADDFTIRLKFQSEGVPKTVGDVLKINKELDALAKQNKAVAVEASQIAGLFNLSGREAADVTKALEETAAETQEATKAARVLAEIYGLSAEEVEQVEAAVKAVTEESKEAKKEFEKLVAVGASAVTAAIGVFLDQSVARFSEFEQFENILQNAFGDTTEVQNAIDLVDTFADQSAQNLAEVEGSFAKLVNRGINPTAEQLRQLSDLAVSQGKSVDQLVEAILDAQTGENERLKEFGIQADATGKQLQLTFRGVNVEVEKTPDAIAAAIFGLGDLEGVAGAASSRLDTLQGRLTVLSNESTRAQRTFGELIGSGFEPLIVGATSLLVAFNDLPEAVQGVVVTSTALVGALSAAVAAVTAYNAVGGKRLVQEAATTIALGKKTAAQAANTIATVAGTVAQAAYAVITGKATAAQAAQIAAITGAAAALAAFTGAAASAGLVVDTFLTITEEARKTDEQIKIINDSLAQLEASRAANKNAEGFIGLQSEAAEAKRNIDELSERLNFVQKFLDGIRDSFGFDTAAEAAVNKTQQAFVELSGSIAEVRAEAITVADALEQGLTVPPNEIADTVAAIDSSIAALKAQIPVTREAVQARDEQIEKLQEYRDRITDTTEGVAALADSTEDLKNRLQELNDELSLGQLQVEQAGTAALAALEEQRAAGTVSAEDYQRQLAGIERAGFEGRIDLATEKLAELRDLERSVTDEEALAGIQAEILETQTAIDKDRIALARETAQQLINARKLEEQAAQEAQDAEIERLKKLRDAAVEAAEARGDALKEQRETQALGQQREFDAQDQARENAFDDQQRDAESAFNEKQRQIQSNFDNQQRGIEEIFRQGLQADQQKFNERQRDAEERFQQKLQDERDQGNREFDALESEVDRRIALAEASTQEEREAIKERIKAEQEAAELRRKVEADVLRQRQSVVANADTDLSPLEQARADFEAELQQKEAEFQLQQQAEKQVFEDAQRQAELAFEETQRTLQEQFEERKRQAEAQFQDEQRTIDRQFQDSQQQTEAAFKDDQRRLDKQNAGEIAALLENARNSVTIPGRARGGPVSAGQPYLVGERGPELIFPNRSGYVATAGETARMLGRARIGPRAGVLGSSDRSVERKLDKLIAIAQRRPKFVAPATINLGGEASQFDAIQAALDHQRAQFRGLGL